MDCFYIVKVKWSKAIYKWMDGMESLNAQMLCSANKSIKNRGYLTFIALCFRYFSLFRAPLLSITCHVVRIVFVELVYYLPVPLSVKYTFL